MKGLFITFEGTEGSGKSTQVSLLAGRSYGLGHTVRFCANPAARPSARKSVTRSNTAAQNEAMTPETELLLMNASRAQLCPGNSIRPRSPKERSSFATGSF